MIIIKVKDHINRFIKKCLNNNIELYNINYLDDYILVTIKEEDFKEIKKLNYYSKITLYKYLGKKNILINLKNNIFNLILLMLFISLIYLYSNIIVSVEIKHENKDIIERINNLLLDNNIKKYTLVKSNQELNDISDKILEGNREFIDFISITRVGMKYIVNIEERIIKDEVKEEGYCHIIAKKDGVIDSIVASSGVIVTEKGMSVKKGDILISGESILNEEIKGNTCASGEIRAITWYKVNVKYPLDKTTKEYTKRIKVNLKVFNKYIKKRLYDNYDEEVIFKFDNIKLVRQKEYVLNTEKLSLEDAKNAAIEEASKKLIEKIGNNSTIIEKKVLNSSQNNSTIELELFMSVNESIGEKINYEGRDTNDTNKGV